MAGGKRAFLHGYHAEIDMHAVLDPGFSHQLQYLKELLEMQVLLICNNVYALNKVICILAVYCGGKVARGVKGCPVGLYYYAGGHVVFRKVNYLCALVGFEKALSVQLVYYGLHLVLIKAFAVVAVELHAEKLIYFANFLERERFHPLPKVDRFRVALLYFPEPCAGFVVKAFILFGFLMEADIKLDKLPNC